MRERRRLNDADLTPEQKAAADARRAQRQTPEYQEELARDIAAIRREFPPKQTTEEPSKALGWLPQEHERQGLSMTERNRKRWKAMTPEQRAAVESIRAQHSTPEFRAQVERDRIAIRAEFPPASPPAELIEALGLLRQERERQGLSLTDMQERTRIDRATISKLERGELPNPTVGTLRTYASALGKRLSWSLVDQSTD